MVQGVRQVEWVEEGAVGGEATPARGSVAELLVGGPYPSLSPPEVPPLGVINEMLSLNPPVWCRGSIRLIFSIDEW
jgi:hypothetical protein